MPMQAIRPGRNMYTNSLLLRAVMGSRAVLFKTSSAEGGGNLSNSKTQSSKGTEKTRPVIKGTQYSLIPGNCSMAAAMVLTKPEEKMKLTESAAPIKSVVFLPST